VYLNDFDWFVRCELGCAAYLRYVDDFVLFGDDKRKLWSWKEAIIVRLAQERLTIHETQAQVLPTRCGIPWLGFVVYPTHRLLKRRNAVISPVGSNETWTRIKPGLFHSPNWTPACAGVDQSRALCRHLGPARTHFCGSPDPVAGDDLSGEAQAPLSERRRSPPHPSGGREDRVTEHRESETRVRQQGLTGPPPENRG
jgi:hypothetical protein